jgi:preprotein translocase subunit SecG
VARFWQFSKKQKTGKTPLYKTLALTHIPPPMTFLAINWLSLSITTLLFIFVIVCLLIGLVVLMQRPKQEGLGAAFGGGVTDQLLGARTTDFLQRATWYLGSLFFLICFTLAILIGKQNKQQSLLNPKKAETEKTAEVQPAPPVEPPAQPASLANELPVTPTPGTEAPVSPVVPEAPAPPAPPVTPEAPAPENQGNKTE